MITLKRLRIFPLAALVFLATIHAYPQESFTGKVVSVTDGDTIQVMHNGRAKKIRLWGIDTPEKTQAFGTKAKQLTSDLAFGKVVAVEVKDTDRYGRTVGVVTLPNGKILNQELVSNGLAWWYEQYAPKDRSLQRLHGNAVKKKLGLWRDPSPVAPWDFRRGKRAQPTAKTQTQSTTQQQTVAIFTTKTGKKYHKDGCRYLSKSKIAITFDRAKRGGLTACSVCGPPK